MTVLAGRREPLEKTRKDPGALGGGQGLYGLDGLKNKSHPEIYTKKWEVLLELGKHHGSSSGNSSGFRQTGGNEKIWGCLRHGSGEEKRLDIAGTLRK